MNITKKFTTSKEKTEFKKGFSSGYINVEVLENRLQPYHQNHSLDIERHCDFWWPSNKAIFSERLHLKMLLSRFAAHALEKHFGEHDFIFKGNHVYRNYILDFEGITVVAPHKRCAVIPDEPQNETPQEKAERIKIQDRKWADFEWEFQQMVLDFLVETKDQLKLDEDDCHVIEKYEGISLKEIALKEHTQKHQAQTGVSQVSAPVKVKNRKS